MPGITRLPALPTAHPRREPPVPPTLTELSTTPAPALESSGGTSADFGPRPCVNGAASDSRACKLRNCVLRSAFQEERKQPPTTQRWGNPHNETMDSGNKCARCAVKGCTFSLLVEQESQRETDVEKEPSPPFSCFASGSMEGRQSRRTRVG